MADQTVTPRGTAKNLAGTRFGRLVAIAPTERRINGRIVWECACDCGATAHVMSSGLTTGDTKSCGCFRKEAKRTHGQTGSPEFHSWDSMIQRCTNPKADHYRRYGGRGITVCPQWFDFAQFFADMGARPAGTTLERRDNNGNYEPMNCRWATRIDQQRNTSRNRIISFDGESMPMSAWAERLGIRPKALGHRLSRWPLARALTTPPLVKAGGFSRWEAVHGHGKGS